MATKEPTTTLEVISPSKAKTFLEDNTTNRSVRRWWVDALAGLITDDKFRLTHQGIAIADDGTILDGQHRLLACVKANRPIKAFVTRGLPRDSVYAIDQGVLRSVVDIGNSGVGIDNGVTKGEVSTVRAMVRGMNPTNYRFALNRWSKERWLATLLRHREAIKFALGNLVADFKVANIAAPVARAYYHCDHAKLERFCECLCTGSFKDNSESAASILARTYLRDRQLFMGFSGAAVLYMKTENALRAFVKRQSITKLYEAESELYPIPEDDED